MPPPTERRIVPEVDTRRRWVQVYEQRALGLTCAETGVKLGGIAESTVKDYLRYGREVTGLRTGMWIIALLMERGQIDVGALMSEDKLARFNSMKPNLQDIVLYAGKERSWDKSNTQMAVDLNIGVDGFKQRLKAINCDMEFGSITEVRVFGYLLRLNGLPVLPVDPEKGVAASPPASSSAVLGLAEAFFLALTALDSSRSGSRRAFKRGR